MGGRQCNFCTFNQLKQWARKRGERVKIIPDPIEHLGGVKVVYVRKDKSEYDAGRWFMAVGHRCACD